MGGRESYSIADMYLLPFYRWGNKLCGPMAELYPRWTRWAAQMLERPAVRQVMEKEGITINGNP